MSQIAPTLHEKQQWLPEFSTALGPQSRGPGQTIQLKSLPQFQSGHPYQPYLQ